MPPADRRYRLERCLGRGGFGEVWLAVMEAGSVQTQVAVKLLNEGLDAGDQALERLRDEGRLLGMVNHPVILKVHDLLMLDGRVALVTEYVDGADLEACFAAGEVPVRALVEVVGRIADALGVAWSARSPTGSGLELVHRDVKPANIRLGRHGDVKLLDFGIARAADQQREARTETSAIVGSVPYMAPERFDAGARVGSAADVFSLGTVLYEGLAGERLLASLSPVDAYVLAMDREGYAGFVARRLQGLKDPPPALRELIAETLAWDPDARPTAAAVAARCEQLAETLPGPNLRRYCRDRVWDEPRVIPAVRPTPAPPPAPAPRRWPWVVAALGGLAAAAAVLVTVAAGIAAVGLRGEAAVVVPIVVPAAPEPIAVVPEPPAPEPPSPLPPPKPRPSAPQEGTFAVQGDVPAELRAEGRRFGPGVVPVGRYELWADFGDGHEPMGTASIAPRGSTTVRCSKLRHNCTGAP